MTDQTRTLQLDRFYVDLGASQGQAPSLQVAARTGGVRPEHLAECIRASQLLPPPPAQRSAQMPSALGIFRGETLDYIIAIAQAAPNGSPQFEFILVPSTIMRAIGGNIRLFEAAASEPFPQFSAQQNNLPPFALDSAAPPDADTQTDDLLALINYCKGDLKVVGGLLAGLVEAMGLGILNAPASLHDRLTFVQGLLTLLPIPARTAITFATSVADPAKTNAQIKFLASDVRPDHHLIFDWATAKLLTEPPDDVYAKFMLSQLRLDTSLVLEQTEKLARTAVWRAMRKDDMANALAWVSRRASLDTAVADGLPADRGMVASVLREDPTLPDDLRVAYTRHLVTLSLALDDPSGTDIVPTIAVQNGEIAESVFEQLRTAASGDHPMSAYRLVEQWIKNPPMGMDIYRWRPLLAQAVIGECNRLLSGTGEALAEFLLRFVTPDPSLQLEVAIGKMIGMSLKRAQDSAPVAKAILLLAVTYLPAGDLQRLLAEPAFTQQLPADLRAVFPQMVSPRQQIAPPGLLVKGAEALGADHQWAILARLVEWALHINRYDLADFDALRGLVRLAASPQGARFDPLIQHVIDVLTRPGVLAALDPVAPYYLVQLSIASERYTEAIRQLEIYQNSIYKGTQREDLADVTRRVFRELPLEPERLNPALDAMQDSQLKAVARANAYIGALENKNWSAEMENAARKLTSILFADPRMAELIGVEPVLRLLKANADRRDATESVRLAAAMVEYALGLAVDSGPELIQKVYPLISWNQEVEDAALEILRTYVRRAPLSLAHQLPEIMGRKFGDDVRRSLDAALRLRLVLVGADFMNFANKVNAASQLLLDMALTYSERRDPPQIHMMRRTVEGLPGGLSDAERARLSQNLNRIGQQIIKLAAIAKSRKGRSDAEAWRAKLIAGQVAPEAGIEALTWIGGSIGEHKPYSLVLEREAPAFMFGNRSVNMLLHETDLIVDLFEGLFMAFPEKESGTVDLRIWAHEVTTLWNALSLYNRRQIQWPLAESTQNLAQLVRVIGDKGSDRSFQSSGIGRQLQTGQAQPRTVTDALRWVSGYFGKEHS